MYVDFVNGLTAAPTRYQYVIAENECSGEQTLAFCRERNAFLDGDYQRGRNQLAALTAIINNPVSGPRDRNTAGRLYQSGFGAGQGFGIFYYAPYKIERGGRPFPAARRKFF